MIFPVVDDLLDMTPTLHSHYKSLGGWTFGLYEYQDKDIFSEIDTEEFADLCSYIDPISYSDRLKTIPKTINSGTGDILFMIDDANHWWDEGWMETSYLRIFPNVNHGLSGMVKYVGLREQAVFGLIAQHDGKEFQNLL